MNGDFEEKRVSLECELEEIENIVANGMEEENIDKIETFMTDFILFIETYIHDVKESPTYKRIGKLYTEEKLFILNMKHIIPMCKGFLRNLKK